MQNQSGFTLIELVVVIVILGILSAVAVPKFLDMRTEAAVAQADGVYGAAQAATALNHAAKLVGKAAADRPAYTSSCTSGLIRNATCLGNALEELPEGWVPTGRNLRARINGVNYTIRVNTYETAVLKAALTKSW